MWTWLLLRFYGGTEMATVAVLWLLFTAVNFIRESIVKAVTPDLYLVHPSDIADMLSYTTGVQEYMTIATGWL